jgi:spermidine dehydrogenase
MNRNRDELLGLDQPITRRDFVNGALFAAGAASLAPGLLASTDPNSSLLPSGSAWTGFGGVGEYRWSNGNTEAVRDAAHGMRDQLYAITATTPVDEEFDVAVVGGGFSGMSAAYEFHKNAPEDQRLLLLDNHPMIGGEAKLNQIDVDGVRLTGPQGSNVALIPTMNLVGSHAETYANYYRELGLPNEYALESLSARAEQLRLPDDHFMPMVLEENHPTGYFFRNHGWALNPRAAQFGNTPWSANAQQELDDFVHNRRDVVSAQADVNRWLDSISYQGLLDRLGYGETVSSYINPYMAVANFGVCGDAISAYAAKRLALPGTAPAGSPNPFSSIQTVSFPGGNAVILRTMLQAMLPNALPGATGFEGAALETIRDSALDLDGSRIRMRLGTTVIRVEHDGPASQADTVSLFYVKDGVIKRIRAKAVVMASGGWVNRRIVTDLPDQQQAAYRKFNYGPVLTANVAVRNWQFFERLGISVARWFEGIGWHLVARRNVVLGQHGQPLSPDQPMMLTFYIPFLYPGQDAATQGILARQQLMDTSYRDFEAQIRQQMNELFGSVGFDARRDIAGIVLNRWGHAFLAPAPGFFFGSEDQPAPSDVIRKGHGRIAFGHSELQGLMNMAGGIMEGHRAGLEAIATAGA